MSINMLIKYSYIKYVPVTQITKHISCTEKFRASYRTIPLILYVRYFLFADDVAMLGVSLQRKCHPFTKVFLNAQMPFWGIRD
jgi:hypothetical protein